MQKLDSRRHFHLSWRFFGRHKLCFFIILAGLIAAASFLTLYTSHVDTKITQIQANSAAQMKKDDAAIRVSNLQKAAALEAKQQAAAKDTAAKAQSANETTASSVDSSTCNTSKTHNNPASIDVVVNKKHCMQPVSYVPTDLVDIGNGFMLSAKAAEPFQAMMAAATAANEPLAITSSYRSYSDQVSTYAYWVGTSGYTGADTYSARPGYSEHQTGLAFDVADASKQYVLSNFAQTSQYQWLQAHAADYGFIQRYYVGSEAITGYEAEEWHYRYVGTTVAKDMKAKGIKTLEQYWNISGGNYY